MPAVYTCVCVTPDQTCVNAPTFQDCDGNPIGVTVDRLGNSVYEICPDATPAVTVWDSTVDGEDPVAPFIPGVYWDSTEECITHYFLNGVLNRMCD